MTMNVEEQNGNMNRFRAWLGSPQGALTYSGAVLGLVLLRWAWFA